MFFIKFKNSLIIMYLNIVIVNIPESSLNVIRQIKNESNSSSDRKIYYLSNLQVKVFKWILFPLNPIAIKRLQNI